MYLHISVQFLSWAEFSPVFFTLHSSQINIFPLCPLDLIFLNTVKTRGHFPVLYLNPKGKWKQNREYNFLILTIPMKVHVDFIQHWKPYRSWTWILSCWLLVLSGKCHHARSALEQSTSTYSSVERQTLSSCIQWNSWVSPPDLAGWAPRTCLHFGGRPRLEFMCDATVMKLLEPLSMIGCSNKKLPSCSEVDRKSVV